MADEDDANNLGDDGDVDVGMSKKGKASAPIMGILKIVLIGVAALILIITIVVITVNIVGEKKFKSAPITEEFKKQRDALDWYSSLDQIRTMTSDAVPASVNVTVVLGYKKDDKKASTEITERRIEIVNFLRNFFSKCTAEDLRPLNEPKLKMRIRDQINDSILTNSKIKDVKFTGLDVIRQ